jgi:hypothetical protein
MTGFDGGRLHNIADYCVHVPIFEMGTVESVHMIIVHYVVNSMRMLLHQQSQAGVKTVEDVELRRRINVHPMPARIAVLQE